jgi:hypothetical protein
MELGSYFLFLQEQIKDIIIIPGLSDSAGLTFEQRREWYNHGNELVKPDYLACIRIATKQSLQEMVAPGALSSYDRSFFPFPVK